MAEYFYLRVKPFRVTPASSVVTEQSVQNDSPMISPCN